MTISKSRSCTGKERYETKALAEDTVAALIRKRGARAGRIHAYGCRHCGGFHVGHKRKYRGQR